MLVWCIEDHKCTNLKIRNITNLPIVSAKKICEMATELIYLLVFFFYHEERLISANIMFQTARMEICYLEIKVFLKRYTALSTRWMSSKCLKLVQVINSGQDN